MRTPVKNYPISAQGVFHVTEQPNLLTLNSSKTELLLIGLKKQLTRYTTPHLIPPALPAILVSSLMNILPSPTIFRPSCYYHIIDSFVVFVLTLIPTQLAPLPPPSFTPNSITVILSTTTYLSLRLPASNRFRTLLLVLLLKLLNPVTSLLSYAVFTGSK